VRGVGIGGYLECRNERSGLGLSEGVGVSEVAVAAGELRTEQIRIVTASHQVSKLSRAAF